jgi:hypothetical protein
MESAYDAARRSARRAGLVRLPVGMLEVAAPDRARRWLGFGDHPAPLRAIGTVDLILAAGLFASPQQWLWMVTRTGLSVLVGTYRLRLVWNQGGIGVRLAAVAMVVSTVADYRTIRALRRGRSTG